MHLTKLLSFVALAAQTAKAVAPRFGAPRPGALLDIAPSKGVYQVDSSSYPQKVVDVNRGWQIPSGSRGRDENAVAVSSKGSVIPGTEGSNLYYGTALTVGDKNLFARKATPVLSATPTPQTAIRGETRARQPSPPSELPKISSMDAYAALKNDDALPLYARHPEYKAPSPPRTPVATPAPHRAEPFVTPVQALPNLPKTKQLQLHGHNFAINLGGLNVDIPSVSFGVPDIPSFSFNLNLPDFTLSAGLMKDLATTEMLSAMYDMHAPLHDSECTRDYTAPCPAGWTVWTEEDLHYCKAPAEYKGPCAVLTDFGAVDPQKRSIQAADCKVYWPCMDDPCDTSKGGRDYSSMCPQNWTLDEQGYCRSPSDGSYSGSCKQAYDLSSYDRSQKERFASTCKVTWPCRELGCLRSYDEFCPTHWTYDPEQDSCLLETSTQYKGQCGGTSSGVASWSHEQRRAFESECATRWPCQKKISTCTPEYNAIPCPSGWHNLMTSGLCEAPLSFNESPECPNLMHFDFWTAMEKEAFAKKCGVTWDCKSDAQENYEAVCPTGYVATGEEPGECITSRPSETSEACRRLKNTTSMSQQEKQSLSVVCNLHWPKLSTHEYPNLEGIARGKVIVSLE